MKSDVLEAIWVATSVFADVPGSIAVPRAFPAAPAPYAMHRLNGIGPCGAIDWIPTFRYVSPGELAAAMARAMSAAPAGAWIGT